LKNLIFRQESHFLIIKIKGAIRTTFIGAGLLCEMYNFKGEKRLY